MTIIMRSREAESRSASSKHWCASPCELRGSPSRRRSRLLESPNSNGRRQACGESTSTPSARLAPLLVALVALDVHPRVAMQILRHSQIAATTNIYSEVSSEETRKALKRLGGTAVSSLGGQPVRPGKSGRQASRSAL